MFKRVFLTVLDSFGVGELPDAKDYGDQGSNTFLACLKSGKLNVPNMKKMGLYNLDGLNLQENTEKNCNASYGKLAEVSKGKDTTTGHWEIAGVVLDKPFPTFPNGFPTEIVDKLKKELGVGGFLCNKPYSGTKVINDYGEEHLKTGYPILYTSADSVLQLACHENVYSVEKLYSFCEKARRIMQGEYGVGRVIARPFLNNNKEFYRTERRHDYSLLPPYLTLLDELKENNFDVISVGKIYDIFAGNGITQKIDAKNNEQSKQGMLKAVKQNFKGLCFTNFVDFDMLYGHRNDVLGYANALNEFDLFLGDFIKLMGKDDLLIVTADHGCDPSTPSTDHSREYIPCLVYGDKVKSVNFHIRNSFSDIGQTIAENFGLKIKNGNSFLNLIKK